MTTATRVVIPTETCKQLDATYAGITHNPTPNTKKVVTDLLSQLITHTLPHTKTVVDHRVKDYPLLLPNNRRGASTHLLITTKKGEVLWEVRIFVDDSAIYQIYWPEDSLTTNVRDEWEEVDPNYLTSSASSAALLVILNSQHITAV